MSAILTQCNDAILKEGSGYLPHLVSSDARYRRQPRTRNTTSSAARTAKIMTAQPINQGRRMLDPLAACSVTALVGGSGAIAPCCWGRFSF